MSDLNTTNLIEDAASNKVEFEKHLGEYVLKLIAPSIQKLVEDAVDAKMETASPEFDINDHAYDVELIVEDKISHIDISDWEYQIKDIVSDYIEEQNFEDKFSQWINNKDFSATITIND
jgi:hypothetical protein|tara:strand:- start:298 stop:654 length:357 start_codon:yes stop_codon:yes gene_type:complete